MRPWQKAQGYLKNKREKGWGVAEVEENKTLSSHPSTTKHNNYIY
jgi:hypothetical protein